MLGLQQISTWWAGLTMPAPQPESHSAGRRIEQADHMLAAEATLMKQLAEAFEQASPHEIKSDVFTRSRPMSIAGRMKTFTFADEQGTHFIAQSYYSMDSGKTYTYKITGATDQASYPLHGNVMLELSSAVDINGIFAKLEAKKEVDVYTTSAPTISPFRSSRWTD